jgi:hypothetical protein
MSAGQSRLELFIDVLDEQSQRALVLPTLTAAELVQEILQEFRALGYLSDVPGDYQLLRASDRSPVDPVAPLGKQLGSRERLILVEHELPLPEQTQRPTKQIYLRDEGAGRVYKLHWLPALIGRAETGPQHALIAVDLAAHAHGLRVSRYHAQITEENGQYAIQALSQNPTTIKDDQGKATTLDSRRRRLEPRQIVYLDKSQIGLRFFVREKEHVA